MEKDLVIQALEQNSGILSQARISRLGLQPVASSMVDSGELLLGRCLEDGIYYFGLQSMKTNRSISVRWLKKPIIKKEDYLNEFSGISIND